MFVSVVSFIFLIWKHSEDLKILPSGLSEGLTGGALNTCNTEMGKQDQRPICDFGKGEKGDFKKKWIFHDCHECDMKYSSV